jgi:chromosome segregation ATPase
MDTNSGLDSTDPPVADLADLRRQFAKFGDVQATHSQSLDIITGKFNALESVSRRNQSGLFMMEASLKAFRDETSGKFERLDNSVTYLQAHFAAREEVLTGLSQEMAELRDDVKVLKTDVGELKTDVAAVKTDVGELKTDVAAVKTDVGELKTDVAELKDNVTVLEVKVDNLQADMVDVKGSLKEILDRLPAKAA